MIHKKPFTLTVARRFLFCIYALILAQSNINSVQAQAPRSSSLDIYVVITPNVTDGQMDQIEKYLLKEGVDISFSETGRTKTGLLTHIKVSLTSKKQVTVSTSSGDDENPLHQPIVFFRLGSSNGTSGLVKGYPEGLERKYLNIIKKLSGFLAYNTRSRQFDLHGSGEIINY